MPVPARITDLSGTAADNFPSGSENVGPNLDNYLRGIQAAVAGDLSAKGADIASASTTDLGAVQGLMHDITGTTTITGFGTVRAGIWKILQFDGALTLTHNGTSLILLGGANRKTAVGDVGIYISDGSGNWREVSYCPANVNPSGLPVGGIGKNAIIGGDFSTNPWQRGTSFSGVTSGAYYPDRFQYGKTGAMVHAISKEADAPTVAQCGRLVTHCLLVDCTTVDSSIASTDFCRITTTIEGYNWLPLAQRTFTLSFWHKHTKTGTYCVSFRNSNGDRSYVAEYTQAVSDAWEKATVTVSASPSSGTWDYTNGAGLIVGFEIASGSSFNTTAGTWQTSNLTSTSNQVNACDSTSNDFRLALVQLEAGSVATEFENRTVQQELALCQRYLPAFGGAANYRLPAVGNASSGNQGFLTVQFPVPTRVPTTGLSVSSAGHFQVGVDGQVVVTTLSALAFSTYASNYAARVQFDTGTSPFSAGQVASMICASSSGLLQFTGCEL